MDFETRNATHDLEERGLDNYSRTCEPILLGWSFDNDASELWQPHLTPELPKEVLQAINSDVTLYSWNCQFERVIFRHALGIQIEYPRFFDVMVQARYLSLPGSLQMCGEVLGLTEDEGKIKDGKRLIEKFCYPQTMGGEIGLFGTTWEKCKEGDRRYHTFKKFRDWETDPEDWEKFGAYCKRDVETERTLYKKMEKLLIPQQELEAWYLDQKINDAGLPVNMKFVENALWMAETSKTELDKLQKERTGLENPNSRDQMLGWAKAQGYPYGSLRKDFIRAALTEANGMSDACKVVLKTRLEASKTSYTKLQRIKELVGPGDRVRHQYLFMGAARTGRWSGTGFQPQNPPRPTKEVEGKYERALELIMARDYDGVKKEFSSVMDTVASVTRSAIQAPPGKKLIVCDLSAIENRVLGWLAGCDAILKVFRDGLDPYVSFACKMYNQPYEVLIKDKEKRQIAKPAVLGSGYSLGSGVKKTTLADGRALYEPITKLDDFGNTVKTGLLGYAENMGIKLTPEQAYIATEVFRQSYPEVVQLWKQLEEGALKVLERGGKAKVGFLEFDRKKTKTAGMILRMKLPSGRYLHYIDARIEMKDLVGRDGRPYQKPAIFYSGIGHGVGFVAKGWGKTYIYSGKFLENGDQADSRDILVHGMKRADEIGFEVCGHNHDELITLMDNDPFGLGLGELQECMNEVPFYSKGLPLASDGYEGMVYKK